MIPSKYHVPQKGDANVTFFKGVSKNNATPKSSILNFNRVFHYKPSILGVFPLFFGNIYIYIYIEVEASWTQEEMIKGEGRVGIYCVQPWDSWG